MPTSADQLAWVEPYVERFEAAWRTGVRPDIAPFLASDDLQYSADQRRQLLLELIAVDLEFAWRQAGNANPSSGPKLCYGTVSRPSHDAERGSGDSPTTGGPKLETYVKRFADLLSLDALPVSLIAEEYRARRRFASIPPRAEYAARFHRHGANLAQALDEVDKELAAEYDRHHGALTAGAPTAREFAAEIERPFSHADYRLQRMIGAGGICKVYAAVDRNANRPVAVKVLKKQFHDHTQVVERFLAEVEISARLQGLNIAPVRGAGRLPGGGYFLVMDLIAGSDLGRRAARERIESPQIAAIISSIAQTIDQAHRLGVIHCDLKPANILLDSAGQPLVSDFGMARIVDGAASVAPAPRNYFAGAPAYAAPEQFDPSEGPIGPHTDVFGLGGILYFLLTGRPSFDADRLASPDDLAAPLFAICRKCLERDWRRRYSTASQLSDDIAAARRAYPESVGDWLI